MNYAKSPHPTIYSQTTEPEFSAAIRKEFVEGSGISESLFSSTILISDDTEISGTEVVGNPIADFLNWDQTEKAGFKARNTFAALLYNEDGRPWQAKLNYTSWDAKKERYGKAYKAPKLEPGEFSPAYLPALPDEMVKSFGLDPDFTFWEQVEARSNIPIVVTEGAKKSLCGLTNGNVSIALYGCDAFSKKIEGEHTLIPDLARFCQPGRTFIIAFDQDANPETIKRVASAIGRLTWLIRKQCPEVIVKVAIWDFRSGKGLDDLVVNCGPEALKTAIDNAKIPPRETVWSCLPTHNNQIGQWRDDEAKSGSVKAIELRNRSGYDSNVEFVGTEERENKKNEIEEYLIFRVFAPATNYDFTVSKMMSDRDGGGMELTVKWVERSAVKVAKAYLTTAETLELKDFKRALTRAIGGHLTTVVKADQLAALIQNRKAKYNQTGGKTYRIADRIGQQDDGVWVFENCQFKKDGTPTTENESLWVFNRDLCQRENVPSPKIAPQDPEALKVLVQALTDFYSPEALPSVWLTMGFAVMGLHRQPVLESSGSMASLAVYGERGGGKSTAQLAAASLYGLQDFKLSDVSVSAFFELAKNLGSLPIQWDDPIRQGKYGQSDEEKVNSALWKLFSALGRNVRGNTQCPETVVCVSTNRTLGNDNAAIASRLISFIFPVCPVNRRSGEALNRAMKQASGGLSQLLVIPYGHQAIVEQGHQLLEHLSESDPRNAQSLATLGYFTQKFCDLAGVSFDALTYIKTELCPQANDQGAGKDSLTDFLEKLSLLKAESLVGEWNLVSHESKAGDRYLALNLASIWETFNQRFKPNYGANLIASLSVDCGGQKNKPVRFIDSKDSALAYQRALVQFDLGIAGSSAPTPLSRGNVSKALLIPREVATRAGFFPPTNIWEDEEKPRVTNKPIDCNQKSGELVTPVTQSEPSSQDGVTAVTNVTTKMGAFEKAEKNGEIQPTELPLGEWDSGISSRWDDFILSERGKNHSPEALRELKQQPALIEVPEAVWAAIEAADWAAIESAELPMLSADDDEVYEYTYEGESVWQPGE